MFGIFKKITINSENQKPEVNYHLLNNSVVVNYLGKTATIANSDERYNKIIELIRNNELGGIPEIVETERQFLKSGFSYNEGILYHEEQPIPPELNERILTYKNLGLPYDSLLKFWENLKQNPSYNARQQLFKFLTHNGHPLTEDGCFIAYRGVTEDFKDKHTGKYDNSVGSVCEMNRQLVDDNPNNTCSTGLHVACFEYAKDFGEKMVVVKVNPRDVVAVPTDYNGTKMRVCKFEVVAVGQEMRTEALWNHISNTDTFADTETSDFEIENQDRPFSLVSPEGSVGFLSDFITYQSIGFNNQLRMVGLNEQLTTKPDCEPEKQNKLCRVCFEAVDSFYNFCPHCGIDFEK